MTNLGSPSNRILGAFPVFILEIRYWFTCRSTISISILGTALVASAEIINEVAALVSTSMEEEYLTLDWIGAALIRMVTMLLIPLLMIKAIVRMEMRWWKGTTWIPVMQIAPATHRERASENLEARIGWRPKVAVS